MDYQQLERVVRALPPAKQEEVLEFAEFLAQRTSSFNRDDRAFYSAGLWFAQQEMGDDPVEYGPEDVRELNT